MSTLRHWILLDLNVFRKWCSDEQVSKARTINNLDGTYGKIFELRSLPDNTFLACSDTMTISMQSGLDAVLLSRKNPPKPAMRATLNPDVMAIDDIQTELRLMSGTFYTNADDAVRRQKLWRRLDMLLKADGFSSLKQAGGDAQ